MIRRYWPIEVTSIPKEELGTNERLETLEHNPTG